MGAAVPIVLSALGMGATKRVASGIAGDKKAPPAPPQPQPDKPAEAALFKRRRRGPGAYANVTPEALGSASTASTKLGQ